MKWLISINSSLTKSEKCVFINFLFLYFFKIKEGKCTYWLILLSLIKIISCDLQFFKIEIKQALDILGILFFPWNQHQNILLLIKCVWL